MNGTSKVKQADGTEKSTPRTFQHCVTESNWLTMVGPTASGCSRTNEVSSGIGYTFDVSCPANPETASIRWNFENPKTQHITINAYSTHEGAKVNLTQEIEAHWVAASCGDVSPDRPVLVR